MVPSDLTTLWQGIIIGFGLFPMALATALTALGYPMASATFEYVVTVPFGIVFKNSQTFV